MGRYEYVHPEIGLQERISILVADELKELGIKVKTNDGITREVGV